MEKTNDLEEVKRLIDPKFFSKSQLDSKEVGQDAKVDQKEDPQRDELADLLSSEANLTQKLQQLASESGIDKLEYLSKLSKSLAQ